MIAGSSRSLDGGDTWSTVPTPPQPLCFTADPFAPSTLLAGIAWGGIYRSTDDGASWQPWRRGVSATYVSALAAGPHRLWAAILHGGLHRASTASGDAAIEWTTVGRGLPAEAFILGSDEDAERNFSVATHQAIAVDPQHPSQVYFAWSEIFGHGEPVVRGGVARSRDGGGSFTVLPIGTWAYFMTSKMWVDPTMAQVLYQQGVFARTGQNYCETLRSTDFGVAWSCINPPHASVDALAVVGKSPGTLYAAGRDSTDPSHALRIWRSRNRGTSWSEIQASGLGTSSIAGFLVSDPKNPSHLYLGGYPSLYTSGDRGATWRQIGSGLPMSSYTLAIDPSDTRRVYVLGGQGLFESHDSGATFAPLADGLPLGNEVFVSSLALDPADPDRIFVGLGGAGVWAYTHP